MNEAELNAANEAGYEAKFEGVLLRDNPFTEGSSEYRAWEAGHLQAASDDRENIAMGIY